LFSPYKFEIVICNLSVFLYAFPIFKFYSKEIKMIDIYRVALKASVLAGHEIMKVYEQQDFSIEIKQDNSPVTQADRRSSQVIAQLLTPFSIPIIDEEIDCPDYLKRKQWEQVWLVDPMDGTKEFISRNGDFTVNIALIENCKPVFGVIYAPVSGELYYGGNKTGAFKITNVFDLSGIEDLEIKAVALKPEVHRQHKLRVAASRSHMDKNTLQFIENLKVNNDIVFISKGSSLKLCMIAEGLVDIYPRFSRTMEWDTAAGHAIVSGTGGTLIQSSDFFELKYNKADISSPPFIALSKNIKPEFIKGFLE
jgi:3'(2'), 5'-bisphosphate nucleotidase